MQSGDRVQMSEKGMERWIESRNNPFDVWGTVYELNPDAWELTVRVRWDNGYTNSYKPEHLTKERSEMSNVTYVRVVADTLNHYCTIGRVYQVERSTVGTVEYWKVVEEGQSSVYVPFRDVEDPSLNLQVGEHIVLTESVYGLPKGMEGVIINDDKTDLPYLIRIDDTTVWVTKKQVAYGRGEKRVEPFNVEGEGEHLYVKFNERMPMSGTVTRGVWYRVNKDGLWESVINRRYGSLVIFDDTAEGARVRFDPEFDAEFSWFPDTSNEEIPIKGWEGVFDTFRPGINRNERSVESFFVDVLQGLGVPHYGRRIKLMRPTLSENVEGQIAYYQTQAKKDRDLRTASKPGRAIKYMFPELSDVQVDRMVDKFRDTFPVHKYHIKVGDTAEDFKTAYRTRHADMQNIDTTDGRKSLACSCMRGDNFDHLDHHPAEAYASGEFKILSVLTEKGHNAGRMVVWMNHSSGKPQGGPAYGVSEKALNMLEEELKSMGGVLYEDGSCWEGAKLQRLEVEGRRGEFYGPYLDCEWKRVKDDGDCLIIHPNGELDASEYQGYIGVGEDMPDYTCSECSDGIWDGDQYTNDEGRVFCNCCYSDLYVSCYETGDEILLEDAQSVNRLYVPIFSDRSEARADSVLVAPSVAEDESIIVEALDGELWYRSDCLELASGDFVPKLPVFLKNYGESEWDHQWYPIDDLVQTVDEQTVSLSELEEDTDTWVVNNDGLYEIQKEEAA